MLGPAMSDHPPPFPLPRGMRPRCGCELTFPHVDPAPCVVLTGGPGAGKTAVLEVVQRQFCEHVVVLPEAATIVFSGGFPRYDDAAGRRGAQLAIFHVQDQMERIERAARGAALVLCDRGLADGIAYWPGEAGEYWNEVQSSRDETLARYAAVIHLRTPSAENGYDRTKNPVRIESAAEAARIDARIERAWADHPRRHVIEASADFVSKIRAAVALVERYVPECCRHTAHHAH